MNFSWKSFHIRKIRYFCNKLTSAKIERGVEEEKRKGFCQDRKGLLWGEIFFQSIIADEPLGISAGSFPNSVAATRVCKYSLASSFHGERLTQAEWLHERLCSCCWEVPLSSSHPDWIWKFTWTAFPGTWDPHKQADDDRWDAHASWPLWQAGTLLPMDISSLYSWNIQDCKLHGTEWPCQHHSAPRARRRGGANGAENTGMSSPKAVLPFH